MLVMKAANPHFRFQITFLLILAGIPAACFGWGADGHKIAARIAEHQLTPQAAAAIKSLLSPESLADVASWADEIRDDPKYDWLEPLHYVNIAPGAQGFDAKRDCPKGKCVVAAIQKYAKVLRDPQASRSDKIEALKLVVHFVGDVHQPLHVALAHDKGGNDIRVEFFTNPTNLHRVWDTSIIRRALDGRGWSIYAREIESRVKQEQRREWLKTTDPGAWATESWKLAQSNAYVIPQDGRLGSEYFDRNRPVIDQRLAMAGIRLGAMLNSIFANEADDLDVPRTFRTVHATISKVDVKRGIVTFVFNDRIKHKLASIPAIVDASAKITVDGKETKLSAVREGQATITFGFRDIDGDVGQSITITSIRQSAVAPVPAR